MNATPTARQAMATGFVDVKAYRILYTPHVKRWMACWSVLGPTNREGQRPIVETFRRFGDAVKFARNRPTGKFCCPVCKGDGTITIDNAAMAAFNALVTAAREFDSDPNGLNHVTDFCVALAVAERVLGIPSRPK